MSTTINDNPANSVVNQIQLDYKPSDFYFYHSNLTPADADCDSLRILECDPNSDTWNDMSFNCYRKELCQNRELATNVLGANTTNLETQTRQHDTMAVYQATRLNVANLMMGIALMGGVMFFGGKPASL